MFFWSSSNENVATVAQDGTVMCTKEGDAIITVTTEDGIADYYEKQLGLDINQVDTDKDGLSDYIELFLPKVNPLLPDADKNGIGDQDEDSDDDGLTNINEIKNGTSLSNSDSDRDGLSDGEEVNKYLTNPLAEDYSNKNTQKCIIMLTDGKGSYNTSLTTTAAQNDIVIYTIGLGSSVSTSVLTEMATGTGGSYYHASDASKLYELFDTIVDESDYNKDTDGDGINDYFEKEMTAGRLRLGTGISVSGIDYLNSDSDNDNLKDGEEITVVKNGDRVYVKLYSNPTLADTDGDEIRDDVDQRKLIPDMTEALKVILDILQEILQELLFLTDKQIDTFITKLPKYFSEKLISKKVV